MKKLLYTLLAVSIIFSACKEEAAVPTTNNSNSSSGVIGSWTGAFVIPLGTYLPNGDSGTFSLEVEELVPDFCRIEGTITSNAQNETIELGLYNGYIEKNSSGVWEFEMEIIWGDDWNDMAYYNFTAEVFDNEFINGLITTDVSPNGTFTGNKN